MKKIMYKMRNMYNLIKLFSLDSFLFQIHLFGFIYQSLEGLQLGILPNHQQG